jgi:cobalt-zinc-cadmium efflux system outer membrane protein
MWAILAVAAVSASVLSPQDKPASPSAGNVSVMTLSEAIARARDRTPMIAAARERQRAAALATERVPFTPNPFIELRGENLGSVPVDQLPRDFFATVTQPVELGGKRRARLAEANAAAGVASAEFSSAEWQLAYDVADLYVEAIRKREARRIVGDQQRSLAEIVALLGERVRQGASPEADLRRFETELTRLGSQVTRLSVDLQSTLFRLSALIGDQLQGEQLAWPAVPPSIAIDPAELSDEHVGTRADVRAAAARVARAESGVSLERSRGWPDLLVTGGYKRTSGYDTAVAGVTIPIALFDRNGAAVARAAGEAGAARFELQQLRQHALAEAKARWTAARELGARAARTETDLIEPAAVVRTAARAAFEEGRNDVLQLVDAERVYGDAAREAVELRLDAILALIHARLAIGESALP